MPDSLANSLMEAVRDFHKSCGFFLSLFEVLSHFVNSPLALDHFVFYLCNLFGEIAFDRSLLNFVARKFCPEGKELFFIVLNSPQRIPAEFDSCVLVNYLGAVSLHLSN